MSLVLLPRRQPEIPIPKFKTLDELKTYMEKDMETWSDMLMAKGEALGLAKGEALGESKGRVKEAREAIVLVLNARFGSTTPEMLEQLEAIDELTRLHAPEELLPKEGWLRFGFPSSYNPDLLEALVALAELGVGHDPVLDEALDHVEQKRGADDRWKLERSLNGKMLADVEHKGQPSKWLTFRALVVLRHFGRL